MKRRTLLALAFSLIICLGLAMPVWAADITMILDGKKIVSVLPRR